MAPYSALLQCLLALLFGRSTSAFKAYKAQEDAFRTISSVAFPKGMFNKCALVGSSPNLIGQNLGQEIDKHDTVIRINRIPRKKFYDDWGRKSDVYFMRHNHMIKQVHSGGEEYNVVDMGDGAQHKCQYLAKAEHKDPSCNISSLVMGGHADAADYRAYLKDPSSFSWVKHLHPILKGKFPNFHSKMTLPMASGREDIAMATQMFSKLNMQEPSTGFHGILMFSQICQSLDLYGFGGTGTADGHQMWDGHPVSEEHKIIAKLLAGTIDKQQDLVLGKARDTPAHKWLRVHLADFAKPGLINWITGNASETCEAGSTKDSCKAKKKEFEAAEVVWDKKAGQPAKDSKIENKPSAAPPSPSDAGAKKQNKPKSPDPSPSDAGAKKQKKSPEEVRAKAVARAVKALNEVVDMRSPSPAASSSLLFDRCAIVSNAKEMLQAGQGAEIDAHDTVIRVTRMPELGNANHRRHMGQRTDVYFARHNHARQASFNGIQMGTGAQKPCDYKLRDSVCNISMLVLGGGLTRSSFNNNLDHIPSFNWEETYLPIMKGKQFIFPKKNPLFVASQSKDIAFAAFMLKGSREGKEPSTGVHAALTFAPVCNRITLYGFEDWEHSSMTSQHATPYPHLDTYEPKAGNTGAYWWLKHHLRALSEMKVIRLKTDSSRTADM